MKKLLSILITTLLVFSISLPTFATSKRVTDKSNLLTDTVISDLEIQITEIATNYNFDVAILTIDSIDDKNASQYADDYFDDMGYGYGENKDGILLLVSMNSRDWAISTHGSGDLIIGENQNEILSDAFLPYLSEGNYEEAFNSFLLNINRFLSNWVEPASSDMAYEEEAVNPTTVLIIILIASAILALITVLTMVSLLNNALPQSNAQSYAENFRLRTNNDIFLYSHTSKIKVESNSNNSSGSNSGHGGSSGKF